jgi:primary-amine oxidase
MDVPPSYSSTPTQMAAGKSGIKGVADGISRLAFGDTTKGGSNDCCGK